MRWTLVACVALAGCHWVFQLEDSTTGPSFSQVSAGGLHTCAIDATGLWCWGDNEYGQLGNGLTTPEILTPTRIKPGSWTAVDTGYGHSCALDGTNQLWCWGANSNGQLGLGADVVAEANPVALSGTWKAIDLGWQNTCASDAAGALWCWGTTMGAEVFEPAQVTIAASWAGVASGEGHTCAVTSDSALWCWGANDAGQLGIGSRTMLEPPTPVPGQWRAVTAGVAHTCALDLTDQLYCWGSSAHGELGAPAADPTKPTRIGDDRWSELTAGGLTTCGQRLDGTSWCWGTNHQGQIGVGGVGDSPIAELPFTTTAISAGVRHTCVIVGGVIQCTGNNAYGQLGDGTGGSRLEPVRIQIEEPIQRMALTARASCATSETNAYCWGASGFGEQGRGTREDASEPARFTADYDAIAAGGQSVCAIADTPGRELFCWGDNQQGQLALGVDPTTRPSVDVPTPTLLAGIDLIALGRASGSKQPAHGCATDTTQRRAVCWGANNSGQLGIPADATIHPTPALVTSPIALLWLTAGANHTCGVGNDEKMWCWGDNREGQLGAVTATDDTHVKQQVGSGGKWKTVYAGDAHTCALDTGGGLWCWGNNTHGQLGDNTRTQRRSPVRIASPSQWAEVSTGTGYTCGIQQDRSLWCWGRNGRGQLGDGSTEGKDEPMLISSEMWGSIAASVSTTCATKVDGALWCWGENLSGQVGDASAWRYGYEPITR